MVKEYNKLTIEGSSKGRTAVFEAAYRGSNPRPSTKLLNKYVHGDVS